MAEEKNNFIGGRMNKDLDERLMRNGEYRDARNVSVSNSDTGNSGSLENVIGNKKISDFGITSSHCEIIGQFADVENNRIFVFITNYNDTSPDGLSNFAYDASEHYIFLYDLASSSYTKLVEGNFLNFSKTNKIIAVNLIENLLFWTDDRNQPRKINVRTAIDNSNNIDNDPYYEKEEHISVAKYYPWNSIRVYKENDYGAIADDSYSLFRAITTDTISGTGISTGTYTYEVAGTIGTRVATTDGSGGNAEVDLVIISGNVTDVIVRDGGNGFAVGDAVRLIDPTGGSSNSVIATLRAQDFKVETTMKDTISKLLPFSGTGEVGVGDGGTTDTFTISSPSEDLTLFEGCLVYVENSSGLEDISISDLVSSDTITASGSDYTVVFSETITISDSSTVYFGANPYYDIDTAPRNANIEDKFVRFSYRFKFDDNEYSLIAPFSQSIFIPKQDGHFLGTGTGDDIDTDESDAYKSAGVRFFENKITNANLIIDLPNGLTEAKELFNEYKVKEVEILMKDSVDASFKLVSTISKDELSNSTEDHISYEYNSTEPTKVLPERETTRVFDKVPVRAKAQEVVGNRVVYGNFIPELPYEDELDFSVIANEKGFQGEYEDAFSRVEYPSHTLKQNRTYQVGIVLSDKFGRQSDVITSDSSTIKHDFRGADTDLMSATDIFMGDSIKVTFNKPIPSQSIISGYRGVYNATDNPLGWYSYKVVVKQQEQSYYNCYVPSILNGYPVDASSVSRARDLAHITLIGDNVNKIPRDFTESNENDETFSSKTKIYPRISSSSYVPDNHSTEQYSPPSTPLRITGIGNRDDLGLNETVDGSEITSSASPNYNESTFYTIPSIDKLGSNPLIARVSTSSALGTRGGDSADTNYISFEDVRLEVVETAPTKSNLDIYWETSTSGLISDLNSSIETSDEFEGFPFSIDALGWRLSEATANNSKITNDFTVRDINGTGLTSNLEGEIVSIINKNADNWSDYFELNKDGGTGKFSINWIGGTEKNLVVTAPNNDILNNLDINLRFTNSTGGVNKVGNVFLANNILKNEYPELDEDGTDFGLKEQGLRSTFVSGTKFTATGWRKVGDLNFNNGSIYSPQEQLLYSISKIEYFNTNSSDWEEYFNPSPRADTTTDLAIGFRDYRQYVRLVEFNNQLSLWYSPLLQSVATGRAPNAIWQGFDFADTFQFGVFPFGVDDDVTFIQASGDSSEGILEQDNLAKIYSIKPFRGAIGIPIVETDFKVTFNVFDSLGFGLVNQESVLFSLNTNTYS